MKRSQFQTREEFEKYMSKDKYMLVADSVMCTKTLGDSTRLYNTIQSFIIEKSIRDIYDASTRAQYRTGKYHFNNQDEFKTSLKKFLKGKVDVTEEYLDDLLSRPSFNDLDDIKA